MVSFPASSVLPEATSVLLGAISVVPEAAPPSVVIAGVPSVVVGAGAAGSGLGSSLGVYCKSQKSNMLTLFLQQSPLLEGGSPRVD